MRNWLPDVGYRGQKKNPFPGENGQWFTVVQRLGQGCVRVRMDQDGRLLRVCTIHIHRPELHGELKP